MSYGTIKVDTITFTDNSVDKSVSLSGLIQNPTFTGNITVTGTISGDVIRGGTTVSGATVTGTTVLATTGAFTSLTGTTIQGTTATYTTGSFTSLTGTTIQGTTATYTTGSFTSLTGTTVTGTTASFTSGVFTNISGTTTTITSGIIASGTAAAPSLAILADLDTGLFSPGANQLAVATNGTGRLFVDASGNVLINDSASVTSNVTGYLRIRQTNAASDTSIAIINAQNSDANATVKIQAGQFTRRGGEIVFGRENGGDLSNTTIADGYIAFSPVLNNTNTERLRITSAGLVGVGTSSVSRLLHISAASGDTAARIQTATSGAFLEFQDSATTAGRQPLIGAIGDNLVVYTSAGSYSERARIDSSGRLGIGTSVPGALLNLQGTFGTSLTTGLRIDGLGSTTNNVSPIAFYIQSSNWGTQHAANIACGTLTGLDGGGYLRFSTSPDGNTAPAERLRITATGLVGIGTASPSQLLHLQGSDIGIFVKNTNSSGTSRLLFGNDLVSEAQIFYNGSTKSSFGGNGALTIYHGGNKPILFATANTERIRIDGSGRLLIGTSSSRGNWFNTTFADPLVQLEGSSSTRLSITRNDNSDNSGELMLGNSRSSAYAVLSNNDNLGRISFQGADGSEMVAGAYIQCFVDGTPGANDMPGRLVFSTTADGAASPTERLRITSAGLVGIKTSSPAAVLTTYAGGFDPSDNTVFDGVGLFLESSVAGGDGNYGSALAWNRPGSSTHFKCAIAPVQEGADVDVQGLAFFTADGTFTTSDPAERLRIDSSGRVGIGDSAPDALLVIKGNSDANTTPSIRLKDGTDTREAWITNSAGDLALNVGGDDNVPHGTLKLFEGGTLTYAQGAGERLRIDSSGRLLVGTSSTSSVSLLLVQGNSSSSTGGAVVSLQRGATSPTSGSLLGEIRFGDSSSNNGAYITGEADGAWTSGSSQPTRLTFFTAAAGSSSPTERMRISQNGQFSVFKDSGSSHFTFRCADTASSSAAFVLTQGATNNTNGTNAFIIAFNGNATNTNNSYGAISDIKLKENIVDANSQWDDLKALQVRKYNFKEGQTHTQIGLVAQEVELVSPGLVSESPDRDEDGNDLGTVTKSVNYSVLYMKAVKALQEAMERIETLEARLTAAGIE
jgi:hypothetical protein